jgi:hypothetical protein
MSTTFSALIILNYPLRMLSFDDDWLNFLFSNFLKSLMTKHHHLALGGSSLQLGLSTPHRPWATAVVQLKLKVIYNCQKPCFSSFSFHLKSAYNSEAEKLRQVRGRSLNHLLSSHSCLSRPYLGRGRLPDLRAAGILPKVRSSAWRRSILNRTHSLLPILKHDTPRSSLIMILA